MRLRDREVDNKAYPTKSTVTAQLWQRDVKDA
jgi:hypothetical protein